LGFLSMSEKLFVAYYRVSTKAQGVSGLGLEAQREAVERYVAGVSGRLIGSFEEVESGKRVDRVNLHAALDVCRSSKATLVIAKLDRLARNVSFISRLLDAKVEFIAADMPSANRLTIHIVAAIAEYEREQISERVKGALRAAMLRGTPIGNPQAKHVQPKAVAAAQRNADDYARRMAPIVAAHEVGGDLPLARLAERLERLGYETPRGHRRWSAMTVRNLKQRIAALKSWHSVMEEAA
jgi:DNA invertase Pin-like site-specific DNA recombinase